MIGNQGRADDAIAGRKCGARDARSSLAARQPHEALHREPSRGHSVRRGPCRNLPHAIRGVYAAQVESVWRGCRRHAREPARPRARPIPILRAGTNRARASTSSSRSTRPNTGPSIRRRSARSTASRSSIWRARTTSEAEQLLRPVLEIERAHFRARASGNARRRSTISVARFAVRAATRKRGRTTSVR